MKHEIYLDYNATTPVVEPVAKAIYETLIHHWGNPSSVHWSGRKARKPMQQARKQLASLLGCAPRELLWTSGATESNNLTLRGVWKRQSSKGRKHLVVSAIEHPAVLQTAQALEAEGAVLTLVQPDASGVVSAEAIRQALREDTALVSVMAANNETGVLQPFQEIGQLCQQEGILYHCDMVQIVGKEEVEISSLPVDFASFSAHKFYGPKGVGALYVRKGAGLEPLFTGGKQEQSVRPGTENLPGIVGMGAAAAWIQEQWSAERQQDCKQRRQRLEDGLLALPGSFLNGHREKRVWNTVNVGFEGIDGRPFQVQLDLAGVAVSLGSACSSGSVSPSGALLAMGLEEAKARNSIRFSLGLQTTDEEITQTLAIVSALLEKSRQRMSS